MKKEEIMNLKNELKENDIINIIPLIVFFAFFIGFVVGLGSVNTTR